MKKLLPIIFMILFLCSACKEQKREDLVLHIIHTTDVHGHVFPYDFINDKDGEGSYSRVSTYVEKLRNEGAELILLDAGDILQGQPAAYYYNFIDTTSTHLFASVLNYMGYDAIVVGNHDIETGHSVYDRWMSELNMPLLGANVIKVDDDASQELPYFQPYLIFQKGDKRIALIGLTNPALTHQLPEVLWRGMRFEDQVETVKAYMPEILSAEPDLIIAMLHSGIGKDREEPMYMGEHVGLDLAKAVPEIDIILLGHDHKETIESYEHKDGKVVWLLNPANDARNLSHTEITFYKDGSKDIKPSLISLKDTEPSLLFLKSFSKNKEAIEHFVNQEVGYLSKDMDARSALFRPSTFIDLIHLLQLDIFPEAEISITAPLSDNTLLHAGDLYMRDLFNLYRYENQLYLMELSGSELKGLLEESYDRWICKMSAPSDPMLQVDKDKLNGQYLPTLHPTYNFDTAAGITYTVDLREERGNRVAITHVGSVSFDLQKRYKVAINSYRGNGGGGLLTEGAGIDSKELSKRVIAATDRDLRYYLMDYLQRHNPYNPRIISTWKFVPEEWLETAAKKDSLLIFKNRPR